jgi:FixJ family two-component response regulator
MPSRTNRWACSPRGGGAVPLVVVIEDDASVARALGRALVANGFAVATFVSGEDFLKSEVARPACLVVDICLGDLKISGFQLHDRLIAEGKAIPVVFITADADEETEERARRVGAAGFLSKPFDAESLIRTVKTAIATA